MRRNVLGIYIGDGHMEAAVLKWRLGGWTPVTVKQIKIQGSLYEATRELVGRREHLKGARVVVGLPHSYLFMGEIAHPNLTPEESKAALELNLASYVHLEPKDIYFDISAYTRNGVTYSLLIYSEKRVVDPILTALNRAGFIKPPVVAPAAVGLDMFVRKHWREALPCVSAAVQESNLLISLHGSGHWHGCHQVPVDKAASDPETLEALMKRLPPPYDGMKGSLVALDHETKRALPNQRFKVMPGIAKAMRELGGGESIPWSICTALAGASCHPPIWLGTRLRERPLLQKIDKSHIAAGAAALALGAATVFQGMQNYYLSNKLDAVERKTSAIREKAAPLKKIAEEVKTLEKQHEELASFSGAYPSPLSVMMILARRLPTSAWIRNFDYRQERVRITVEGGQAVKVIEQLKGIPAFGGIRLASPVTKFQGKERYTLEITLKPRKG